MYSMTCEAVTVEKVGMFDEDDSFTLWYLANVNLIEFHKVEQDSKTLIKKASKEIFTAFQDNMII